MEGLIKPKVLRRQTFNKDSTVVLGEYSHKDKAFDGQAIVITRTENYLFGGMNFINNKP